MSRQESFLDGVRYSHHAGGGVRGARQHTVEAHLGAQKVGHLFWDEAGGVGAVAVRDEYLRRGIGRGMWEHARAVAAASGGKIPEPKHSTDRSLEGDAWAQAVGGHVPPLRRRVAEWEITPPS
jgi:GNAT superfamily N-acetyltransferase